MTLRRNSKLHIPEPNTRPGDPVDFSWVDIPDAGSVSMPPVDAQESNLRDMPFDLIRTIDDVGKVRGDWTSSLSSKQLLLGLRSMMLNRAFDERMFVLQRQGKTSFFMKTTGEEALGVSPSMVLRADDMCFPTYRNVGWLLARDYPIEKLANQIFSNEDDPLKGRQLPILYSAKEYGFYSLSGNLGSRIGHAVGWAMAAAYSNTDQVALSYVGEGTTAEGSFHEALTFASVYRAPVILCINNNQWAISSFAGIAGAQETTFAAKAVGYGIPGLRVDGNDFLAVSAAIEWAAMRARAGKGATLIEFFTYRAEGHSTSDDPTKYRPKEEGAQWPLGDPIERLKTHLIEVGLWDEERQMALTDELKKLVRDEVKKAEAIGTLGQSKPSVKYMFEDVFKEPDWRNIEQRRELGI